MNLKMLSKKNALLELAELGQSIWLDYTRRDLILSRELRRLIDEDGLRGMTSNPSIFEKAIVGSPLYEEDIRTMTFEGQSPKMIYEPLSQRDVQGAADEFRSVYNETDGRDGYVSLEVNPHLAHDTKGTIAEARRLWRALNPPHCLNKTPRHNRRAARNPATHQRGHQRQYHVALWVAALSASRRGLHCWHRSACE